MTNVITPTGRATLALAAARGMRDTELAEVLQLDPATLSRKKTGKSVWNDNDAIRAYDALADGIEPLIRDLQRLRATRQYHAATGLDRESVGQAS